MEENHVKKLKAHFIKESKMLGLCLKKTQSNCYKRIAVSTNENQVLGLPVLNCGRVNN